MGCSGSKSTGTENSQTTSQNAQNQEENSEEISVTEEEAVQHVMNELGISKERAEKMVKKANKCNDGKIETKELIKLGEMIKERKKEMKEKFDKYDADDTGKVTVEEACTILKEKWPDVNEESLKVMVKRYDFDGSGKVDYKEFIYFYANVSVKKEEVKRLWFDMDENNSGSISSHEACKVLEDECFIDEKMAKSLFEDFDKDKDGKLNKEEFSNFFMALFA